MTAPAVSIIVVSRHRTALLLRCLASLRWQDHPRMEVIVVADPAAIQAVEAMEMPLKLIRFDIANISAARNAGLVEAAGEVVGFIDDDAVAEPTWARRLAEPFANPKVDQAGGFVRGRNGISWQWRALEVDAEGRDHAMKVGTGTSLHQGTAKRSVKTQGTNCAFRRDALLAIGGFDPAYRYYYDETDVNLRLAAAGGLTAVVPAAVVHHGYAASAHRRSDRAPTSLHEIGASTVVFGRRHAPDRLAAMIGRMRRHQRRRLISFMVGGVIEPRDVSRLIGTLEAGIADGRARAISKLSPLATGGTTFLPLPGTGPRDCVVLSGWAWQRRRLADEADQLARSGKVVCVMLLSPGFGPHRERFALNGVWWQEGGRWGHSERSSSALRPWRLGDRLAQEVKRFEFLRGLGESREPCPEMGNVSPE